MRLDRGRIKEGLQSGLRKGLSGFLWIMKILIPVSLFTALLAWTGWLGRLDVLLQPLMSPVPPVTSTFFPEKLLSTSSSIIGSLSSYSDAFVFMIY